MTIAACYVSQKGIVLGADSTASYSSPIGFHYYNHNQKLFEIGESGTLGVVTWGLSGLGSQSYRTLFALLADGLDTKSASSVSEVVDRWVHLFWNAYQNCPEIGPLIARCKDLSAKPQYVSGTGQPGVRTKEEEDEFQNLKWNLGVGFCIGGYVRQDRQPAAFSVFFDPLGSKPAPERLNRGYKFWARRT
jgi:hypothetical protein